MKIEYVPRNFSASSIAIIESAERIIDEYVGQGFLLTLRQLYYQFVARGLVENTTRAYKRIGSIVNDARLAGLLDWSAIEDRTRSIQKNSHWHEPSDIIMACGEQFQVDKWRNQPRRVEVWVEKEALAGVLAGVCSDLDVPFFSCRGYTSQSEMWNAGQRLIDYIYEGQEPLIIHLGDHDPSGVDMTRDISDRLMMFTGEVIQVERVALNMDQINEFNPPPNPTKITDSRATSYIRKFGTESWELDALEPSMMVDLVYNTVLNVRDEDLWAEAEALEDAHRKDIKNVASRWPAVSEFANDLDENEGTT